VDRFGWTTFDALAQKPVSHSVHTADGAGTTVDTETTFLSHASRVLLPSDSTIAFQNNVHKFRCGYN